MVKGAFTFSGAKAYLWNSQFTLLHIASVLLKVKLVNMLNIFAAYLLLQRKNNKCYTSPRKHGFRLWCHHSVTTLRETSLITSRVLLFSFISFNISKKTEIADFPEHAECVLSPYQTNLLGLDNAFASINTIRLITFLFITPVFKSRKNMTINKYFKLSQQLPLSIFPDPKSRTTVFVI